MAKVDSFVVSVELSEIVMSQLYGLIDDLERLMWRIEDLEQENRDLNGRLARIEGLM